jgi:hypothetical protein
MLYIIKGRVTDSEAHQEACRVGDLEWRLADCYENPSVSYDYLTLEELVYDNPGKPMVFVIDGYEPQPSESPESRLAIMTGARNRYAKELAENEKTMLSTQTAMIEALFWLENGELKAAKSVLKAAIEKVSE